MTPTGIEPATFQFVAQNLNRCATAVPRPYITKRNIVIVNFLFVTLLDSGQTLHGIRT